MTDLSRRGFLKQVGLAGAAAPALAGAMMADAQGTLPRRTLGRTNRQVSILAFGGGSRFLMYEEEEAAFRVINQALELGLTYVDTAFNYGQGKSESRIGKALGKRRAGVFLATKMPNRDFDGLMRTLEGSLRRLQTDHVDLLHIHGLGDMADLEKIEREGGLKALYRAREQKMASFIGMTCHEDGAVLKTAIERHDLDCVQMALNASRNNKFEELALPAARKKNLGVIAMKVTAQEKLVGQGTGRAGIEALMRYSLSLPVATCVIGMPKPEHLEQNAGIARAFRPLAQVEMDHVHRQVAPAQAAVERFFSDHIDA